MRKIIFGSFLLIAAVAVLGVACGGGGYQKLEEPDVVFSKPFDGAASHMAYFADIDVAAVGDMQRSEEVGTSQFGGVLVETNSDLTENDDWLIFRIAGTDDVLGRGAGKTTKGIDYWVIDSYIMDRVRGKTIEALYYGENGEDVVVLSFIYEGKRIYINIDESLH